MYSWVMSQSENMGNAATYVGILKKLLIRL